MTMSANYHGSGASWVTLGYPQNVIASTKWHGGGWGNMDAKLDNLTISFNWEKNDGSIATYNKTWETNFTGHNVTACII